MKEISVTLEGEKAEFYWKDGKVYCTGYDLESEKAVLALTGFGAGVGVLLVALNDSCKNEAEFMSEVTLFVAGYNKILSNKYAKWPQGQLLFEYLSYSPDPSIRWREWRGALISEKHYKRLFNDPEPRFKVMMACLKELPEKYFHQLLKYDLEEIKFNLAQNESCPLDILESLTRDNYPWARQVVAGNPALPPSFLQLLSQDTNKWVRTAIALNTTCPESLLRTLANDEDTDVRITAQEELTMRRGLGL